LMSYHFQTVKQLTRPSGLLWLASSAAVSGLSTYAFLAVVATGLGPQHFDDFSLYWALLIAISVGGFLPLEQILARRGASGEPFRVVPPWPIRRPRVTALVAGLLLLGVLALRENGRVSIVLLLCFALNLAAGALQSVLRGAAAGRNRLDFYAYIVCTEALLRFVLCVVIGESTGGGLKVFACALAVSCWASVVLGVVLLRHPTGVSRPVRAVTGSVGLSAEALRLVPAMLSMQVLLNSPIFVAYAFHDRGANAGRVLAIASLVRTSVFVAQAAQAAYVARIAGLVHDHSPQVRQAVSLVLVLALALASATVVTTTIWGSWLVELLYGRSFAVSRPVCLLVSAGIGVFLVAVVANDLAVACGRHRHSASNWAMGAGVGAVSALLLPPGNIRTFGVIILGSAVALLLTGLRLEHLDPLLSLGIKGRQHEDANDKGAAEETGPVLQGEDNRVLIHLAAMGEEPDPHQPREDNRDAARQ
jgi:hypothetical protein